MKAKRIVVEVLDSRGHIIKREEIPAKGDYAETTVSLRVAGYHGPVAIPRAHPYRVTVRVERG